MWMNLRSRFGISKYGLRAHLSALCRSCRQQPIAIIKCIIHIRKPASVLISYMSARSTTRVADVIAYRRYIWAKPWRLYTLFGQTCHIMNCFTTKANDFLDGRVIRWRQAQIKYKPTSPITMALQKSIQKHMGGTICVRQMMYMLMRSATCKECIPRTHHCIQNWCHTLHLTFLDY